jgi:hypothetical protein
MTNQQHPITPPPELLQEWRHSWLPSYGEFVDYVATHAAQWAANMELDACCEWLDKSTVGMAELLRTSRRPKPPSLKEQALDELVAAERLYPADWSTIRRALEQLND